MSDDRSTFETTRARLEDIVVQVRRKDVSLEQSLDMLEEAVRLVNQCNELIDQTSFRAPVAESEGAPVEGAAENAAADAAVPAPVASEMNAAAADEAEAFEPAADLEGDEGEDASVDAVAVVETFELLDLDGADIGSIEFIEMIGEDAGVPAEDIEDDERS